ncbi:hypothetical protein DPEC_G00239520 [Dallia pectoralis]|uniref:Uncharacterized protein n=1 Tax=Dallia pectoralis TaxID=75939 RepID=A0ACC2FZI8_DALPE|nr:hypothetical protein DPEC_G00239520 [Dallia pectoralis]
MALAGLYKCDDDGNKYTANCFPIRSFFHQRKGGAGHWLVAHRNAVEHKHRNRPINGMKYGSKSIQSKCPGTSALPYGTLDAHLLLSLHCVDKPSDLCSVDISEQRLNLVMAEDLTSFENVAYVNASDNCLTIEPFGKFPSLRELELSLNCLRNVKLNAQEFPHLEALDLSYNNLSGDDILPIGLIPCLKVLHLTGNQLQFLPPNMAVHCNGTSQRTKDNDMGFQRLEVLMLDDNKLTSGVFSSLANLRRLQHLNLQGNHISEIPEVLPKSLQPKRYYQHESDKQHEIWNHCVFDDLDTNFMNANSDITEHLHQTVKNCIETEDEEEFSRADTLPLPELGFLNLADNKIVEEEALLSLALFPMLREVVIHSNPLTTQRSGDPPLLTYFLQERLGIHIRRNKPSAVIKPLMMFPIDSKWKIETTISKIPRVSLLRLLETPCTPAKHDSCPCEEKHAKCLFLPEGMSTNKTCCSSQSNDHAKEQESIRAADAAVESSDDTVKMEAPFFVTQVTDVQYASENHLLSDKYGVKEFEKNVIPEKLKGFELLLDAEPDPDMVEHGIQHTVRMLKQTLNTLLVYRDSIPNVDCIQKPYTHQEKRVEHRPGPRPKKHREERVEEMLNQMKERKAIRKIPLSSVLKGKGVSKEENEEALTLLMDMKKKYKMIYTQAVEQATQFEFQTISGQD